MNNIQKLWNDWINSIKVSDNEQYIKSINLLKNNIKILNKQIDLSEEAYDKVFKQNDKLINQLYELTNIEFKPKNTYYNWRGKGSERIHLALDKFSLDQEAIELYINYIISNFNLNKTYDNPDILVYNLVKKIYLFVNNRYTKDKTEYWYTPQEAFDVYVLGKSGDCDDLRAFIYGCIVAAFKYYGLYDEYINRIKCVDINLPFGHAIISYRKNNGVYALIESTAYEERFAYNWNNNSNIYKSVYTRIWHIFDENKEYVIQ